MVNTNSDNQHLTKRERYLKRKTEKEEAQLGAIRQQKIKIKIGIMLAALFVISGVVFITTRDYSQENQNEDQNTVGGAPRLEINPKEYDAGAISMAAGKIIHPYEIRNTGTGDLELSNFKTSCMCTTARLKVSGQESPEFGMHNNFKFWAQKIAPGETGLIEVTFDPAFHGPQGLGPVVRAVNFTTNDPQNSFAEVKLSADVLP